jgi:FKBP-type peptidyl-prolyl cis-trans isomerase
MMRHSGSSIVLAALVLAVACGGGDQPGPEQEPAVAADSAPSIQRDQMTRSPSGLEWTDLEPGTGAEAQSGHVVRVHYTGWLLDGPRFDSSHDRPGNGFSFTLGQSQVISGWEEGVAGMKVGGKRRLVIPPDLGYGARGSGGVIPPNATLVFDVQLLEIVQ